MRNAKFQVKFYLRQKGLQPQDNISDSSEKLFWGSERMD